MELYGKPIGNEVCDVRGSSADEDLEIFEVCRIFFFTASYLFPHLLIPLAVALGPLSVAPV